MYESPDKMVSHPAHYQSETGLEVIDVIEAFTFDLKGIEATDTGNIIKYALPLETEKRHSGPRKDYVVYTASYRPSQKTRKGE